MIYPTVSVVITTYNRPKALKRAIESALKQTLKPLEILVCEDGSSVEVEQIITSFNCPQIKRLSASHAGRPAIPRNRGVHVAQGEWLAFLDDDDLWLPDKLERQIDLAQASGCRAVCTNAWRIQNGKRMGTYFSLPLPAEFSFWQLLRANLVICSSSIVHHDLFEEVIGFPEAETLRAIEDYALWLRVAALTNFAYLPEPLLEYTDEPTVSIRNDGGTVQRQKFYVLQDFSNWARNANQVYFFLMVKLLSLTFKIV